MIVISFYLIRQSLFLSPKEAAELLQVDISTYKRWEATNPPDPLAAFVTVANGAAIEYKPPAAIRAMRLAAGLTQGKAAGLVGVKPLTWVRWEAGRFAAPAWRLVLFSTRAPSQELPPEMVPPSGEEVRAARIAAGLSIQAAVDLVYSGAAVNWPAVESGRDLMPLHVWELLLFKLAAPGRPAPSLPPPDVLRAARKAAKLTQDQAAELVGIKRATWAAWEAGHNKPGRAAWELFLFKTA